MKLFQKMGFFLKELNSVRTKKSYYEVLASLDTQIAVLFFYYYVLFHLAITECAMFCGIC